MQFIDAYRPVLDKILFFAGSLRFTLETRHARVATRALQVYSIAKGLARDPDGAAVAAHVQHLKRDLRRRGRARTRANSPAV